MHIFEKGAFFTVPWVWGFLVVPVCVVHPKLYREGRGTRGICPPLPGLVPYHTATAHGLTTSGGGGVARCKEKSTIGKKKVVCTRGKCTQPAHTPRCTALMSPPLQCTYEDLLKLLN